MISELDKVIFTVCEESKNNDKNNSDLLALSLKLVISQQVFVKVEVFMSLFVCVPMACNTG